MAKYPGVIIRWDGRLHKHIYGRTSRAKVASKALGKFWDHSTLDSQRQARVYKAVILPVLTYGISVTCPFAQRFKKEDACFHSTLRRTLGIKFTFYTKVIKPLAETTTNAELKSMTGIPRASSSIKQEQLKMLGLALRALRSCVRSIAPKPKSVNSATSSSLSRRSFYSRLWDRNLS